MGGHVTNDNGVTTTKTALDAYNFNNETDVSIYPVYAYNGSVSLIPIDSDGDGETDSYQVGGYNNGQGVDVVEIPAYVNGLPITSVAADAFASYPDLHAIYIPTTVVEIGYDAIAEGSDYSGEEVTIYYAGAYAQWVETEAKLNAYDSDWDRGIGNNSRIFYLNGTDQVDPSQGYMQRGKTWFLGSLEWSYNATVTTAIKDEYAGNCGCDSCNGDPRPDQQYWQDVVIN